MDNYKAKMFFVGYQNEKLVAGTNYKYTISYEANITDAPNLVTGQSAKRGIFMPSSSGAPIDSSLIDKNSVNIDVAMPGNSTFKHVMTFKALKDGQADVGVSLGSGSVLPTTPFDTIIWKSALVEKEVIPGVVNTPPNIIAKDKIVELNGKHDPLEEVDAIDAEDGNLKDKVTVTKIQ
ncbi:hypothetical protein AZF37_08060 [endosymbiont 'TC1' of Trimyema compressum]|uniref:hypothetical protein n=1 Tax=endosymbiont 'TC1' of Trimyema compressum TaxID=243899 RepID=UPI0007F13DCA|nr:hypothetical protein [endosymbiont 'TC1' of Trimyema compressum]AMP21117.1 hypothetical protein AZF37_08060 [endosymbiont 'TC1' of Trimyema compressum]